MTNVKCLLIEVFPVASSVIQGGKANGNLRRGFPLRSICAVVEKERRFWRPWRGAVEHVVPRLTRRWAAVIDVYPQDRKTEDQSRIVGFSSSKALNAEATSAGRLRKSRYVDIGSSAFRSNLRNSPLATRWHRNMIWRAVFPHRID